MTNQEKMFNDLKLTTVEWTNIDDHARYISITQDAWIIVMFSRGGERYFVQNIPAQKEIMSDKHLMNGTIHDLSSVDVP